MSEPQGHIHSEHPFATPPELREPARLFRGRLAAPVTVWTSGEPGSRAGLTVSSLLVAMGEPSRVFGLVGDLTDLWEAARATGTFVVHVLGEEHRLLADRFAGLLPSPGGLFRGLDVEDSEWGPVLSGLGTRAYCRLAGSREAGHHRLVEGTIERVVLKDLERPLVHFRGRYRPRGGREEAPE